MRFATSFSFRKKLVLTSSLALFAFSALLFVGVTPKASAADCDNNAIIWCGKGDPGSFITQVRKNDSLNGHHDLQAIYAYYGLEPAEYDRFVTSARTGTSDKNGNITVDGQIVATGVKSIGRQASKQGSGYFTQTIPGAGTYYGNINQKAFASNSIPVMVMFNAQGVMEFAVLTSCGNPTNGTNVVPGYDCKALNAAPVTNKPNTYSFTTEAPVSNNANVVKVVYDFGDGTSSTQASPATPVEHAYDKANVYTAKVTVYVSLPGNQTITVTSINCTKTITIIQPYYTCVQLAGAILDQNKYSYSFVATAKYGNGATFVSADFDFGDGKSTNGAVPAAGATTVTTEHTYAAPQNYRAVATLHFIANGLAVTATSDACGARVTPTHPPTSECKPGIPQGSPMCTPCATNASLPSNSPQCVAPATTTLPNTGAGDVIAMFAVAAVVGFYLYRQFIYKKHGLHFAGAGMAGIVHPHTSADEAQKIVDRHHGAVSRHDHRQALEHPNYKRPHRFRPGSHHNK